MEKIEKIEFIFINELSKIKTSTKEEAIGSFLLLWNDQKSYNKHLQKRLREDVIQSDFDYLLKTLEVLSFSKAVYIESFPNQDIWERQFYNKEDSWAVVIGENGRILSSYQLRESIINRLEKHKELYNSKYDKKGVSDELSKTAKQIYERLTRI